MKHAPQITIFCQRLYWNECLWSLTIHYGDGSRKRIGSFSQWSVCREAATRIANKLDIPIQGRHSGFYKKLKRAEAAAARVVRTPPVRNSQIAAAIGNNALRTIEINGGVYRCKHSQKRLLRIEGGRPVKVDPIWLRDYFDRHMRFVKAGHEVRCPAWITKFVFAKTWMLRLPVLDSLAVGGR